MLQRAGHAERSDGPKRRGNSEAKERLLAKSRSPISTHLRPMWAWHGRGQSKDCFTAPQKAMRLEVGKAGFDIGGTRHAELEQVRPHSGHMVTFDDLRLRLCIGTKRGLIRVIAQGNL